MSSTGFQHIAAACRQAYNGVRRPSNVLEGVFNHSPDEIPQLIQFFYEDGRIEERLNDEDMREIFFLLSDVYPEEVADDPDLIQVLADLSDQRETRATFAFVFQQMKKLFEADTNKVRSLIIYTLLKRIRSTDMYWILLRFTRRANPFRRRDVVYALSAHFNVVRGRLIRESAFTPLPVMAKRLANGDEMIGVPSIGDRLLMALPRRFNEQGQLPHPGENHIELIRGERLVAHNHEAFTSIHDPNGDEIEMEEGVEELFGVLPYGIFIIERVPTNDFPFAVVDVLLSPDGIHDKTWKERREWLEECCPDFFIKQMMMVENYKQLKAYAPPKGLCFIHNGWGRLSYTNSRDEVVRFSTKASGDVFRLIGGVWKRDDARGLVMNVWRVAARDGVDGYYTVGDITAEPDVEKQLNRNTEQSKASDGEVALMKGPTFVEVDVHFADYDDRGILIQGNITRIVPDGGISDVIPVEEVEWLVGEE